MLKDCQPKIDQDTYTLEPLTQRSNVICYDDDDDEESTSQLPPSIAITTSLPVLPTVEPEGSLIMGDENLSTIPEKESDEVIKSSVKDLVPIPSESEDTSDNDSKCDLPFCDDSPLLDVLGGNSVTFTNPLSDSNDDFTSKYISSDINPLYNKVLEDIDREKSLLAIDELFLLDTPPPGSKLVSLEKIDADIPLNFEDDYYNSEGDIIYLESLLINDTIPNLPPEDRHYLSLTCVIQFFLPFLTYPVKSPLLLSSGSEDTIFDPGISAYSFYSSEPVASHQNGTFMIALDYGDSRARGFVHRSLELHSLACLYMGIRYPRSS
ncbi:hypothetical protein Tco_0682289 [Tanacetum coccineum]|uniref:Uncharacterized protein n=1 Tax=Tanacetum coccineum TaxID=301880 RepID=A0ABQ4XQZ2_9ASTR